MMGGSWVPVLIGSVEFLFGIRLFLLVEAPSFIMCFIISGLLNLIAILRIVSPSTALLMSNFIDFNFSTLFTSFCMMANSRLLNV